MELLLSLMELLIYLIMLIYLKIHQTELSQIFELQTTLYQLTNVSKAFLNLVFCLVVNNNSGGKSFPLNILIFILKIRLCLFLTAVFSLFNCESDSLAFTLLYSTIYIFTKLLLFFCKILRLFLLIFEEQCIALSLCYMLLQYLLEILFVGLLLDQHLKLFVYLIQLQLVFNCL